MSRRAHGRLQSVRRQVQLDGLRMSVLDWMGPEQQLNPPVVLLHGALQTAEGMGNLASHLARGGRVVVPDLRGRGESSQPENGYDPGTMAADVAQLIEKLEIDRPIVIGRLHGGVVAYHLAANHPASLSGLVIGDTLPEVSEEHARRLLDRTRSLPRTFATLEDASAFYQQVLGLPLERALHDIPFDLVKRQGGYRWRHNLDVIERIEEAALPRSDWDVLAKIKVPTLILRGQRGALTAEMATRMCEQVADCSSQTILSWGRDVFLGGGAEQTFAAIDIFLLRQSDRGLASPVPERPGAHARSFIEPLVRALNGKDIAALTRMFDSQAAIEIVRDQQTTTTGGTALVETLMSDLFERLPSTSFTVERSLASRREAAVVLAARSLPLPESTAGEHEGTLYVDLWFDVSNGAICNARLQLARIPGDTSS